MSDIYQYPVFFECHSLGREQIKRIVNYFRIRRRSGGGDCGPLRSVKGAIYSVAFKHQKDQQAVLQRSEHVVELTDGRLVFTVRGSLEPHASSPSTPSSADQDFTAPVQSPQSIPASTPPPSGEEYELKRDSYLFRYLKECPKAGKALEKELASVACSAQLYPEEERVLVRTVAQPGAVDEDRNWKAKVDKLFDGYLCHYEFDPHKVKVLLQSCSSRQTTDEVKVYSEAGMAVVVGERSQVNARLMDVEDRSRLSEKQTSIHRLGEAKLRLLWKEIKHSLGRDFPGVKVTQGDSGQLVLEGSVEEIVEAGDLISDKEKLVLERTVSDMRPHVLAFLKKAYGGPGVLGDYLGLGDKVEVELRDTELRFFTLSADKLDDIEKRLQGEIREVQMYVPNCSAVPSELQEKLKSKTNEMNQEQYRVQVVFGSDSTVCLLGHSKEVEELSETVTLFILDQSDLQNIVHLPFPELAQELPELLQLHGFDYSGVTFHPLSSSSGPMVVLEGPSSKVTEVRNRLGPFLDSLLQDRVTIDPFRAIRYFQSPIGKDELLRHFQAISTGNSALSDFGFPMDAATRDTASEAAAGAPGDGVHVEIIQGTIETQQVFKSVQETLQLEGFTKDVHQPDQVSTTRRIVLLGKTGSGKSNLANTIFGEEVFTTNHSPDSGTRKCQTETKSVNGRSITLIDTPGFFDTDRSEEDLKPEIVRCITECAPGPHAFLIVLKVEKFTEHEQAVITKIRQYFSEDALTYAVIVFTHGDDLPEGMKIEEFVSQNKDLSDLVKKCGSRCHVIDNKYWKNNQQNDYRNNQFQVEDLLNTIDSINDGGYYTNKMFQEVEKEIQKEVENISQSSGNMPIEEIRKQAKSRVSQRFLIQLAGTATGALLGAIFGLVAMVRVVIKALQNPAAVRELMKAVPDAGAVVEREAAVIAVGAVAGATAAGGIIGGAIGYDAAGKAGTAFEAVEMAAKAVTTTYETKILKHLDAASTKRC